MTGLVSPAAGGCSPDKPDLYTGWQSHKYVLVKGKVAASMEMGEKMKKNVWDRVCGTGVIRSFSGVQ